MELLDYEITCKKDWITWQKKYIKRCLYFGMIYPALIIFCSVNAYNTPHNWVNCVALGINIASFLFYIITMLDAIHDYKQDRLILEWYETRNK